MKSARPWNHHQDTNSFNNKDDCQEKPRPSADDS